MFSSNHMISSASQASTSNQQYLPNAANAANAISENGNVKCKE